MDNSPKVAADLGGALSMKLWSVVLQTISASLP